MLLRSYEFTPIRALWDTYENYIWLLHNPQSRACIVIDPGEAKTCLKALEQLKLSPKTILLTHQHHDHVNGVSAILDVFGSLPIYGSLNNPFPLITNRVKEKDTIYLPEIAETYTVMETPGHTEDHISFYNDRHLISGDALFTGGCGKLLGGTIEQLYDSINKMKRLPDKTNVYSAHEYTSDNLRFAAKVEPSNAFIKEQLDKAIDNDNNQVPNVPSTIYMEKKINPFMRSHIAEIKVQCETYKQKRLHTSFEVFSVLREWRG